MAHVRQSRPDSGLDFQAKVIQLCYADPCALGSRRGGGRLGGVVGGGRPPPTCDTSSADGSVTLATLPVQCKCNTSIRRVGVEIESIREMLARAADTGHRN